MRQSQFTETHIVSIQKEADADRKVKNSVLEASNIKRLKELEHENSRLKPLCCMALRMRC